MDYRTLPPDPGPYGYRQNAIADRITAARDIWDDGIVTDHPECLPEARAITTCAWGDIAPTIEERTWAWLYLRAHARRRGALLAAAARRSGGAA